MTDNVRPATPAAATALRILSPVADVLGVEDSLENIDTTILPDGCLAYVLEVHTSYRLHKQLVPPINGVVAPASGPGGWVPEAGSAMFIDNAVATPGTIGGNSSSQQSLVPSIPLLSTDILFGASLDETVPSGIVVVPKIDTTTVPETVRVALDFINGTGGGIVVPDGLRYYFIVYRPL